MINYSRILKISFVTALLVSVLAAPAWTQAPPATTGKPLPRFVSLRADEVNLRTGPGVRYPVDWVYQQKYLPVEVIAEFGTWRKVRDVQGSQGWIHQNMLSSRRMFVVTGQLRTIRKRDDSKSPPIAKLEPNVVGELKQCPDGTGWCKIRVNGYEGWLRRVEFWGTYPQEMIK
ncbi:MAG: SH3 domain-containing protein [Rhodospirillales bacterium]|nr:SH3 domain-containing protein [Rhodospirillales bacterium]